MLLKKGDNNEDVKKLQAKLGVEPMGNFGPKTETAVKEWQAANGLTADGIVGPATWAKIMGESIATQVATPVVAPQPVSPSSAPQVAGLNLTKLKGHVPQVVIEEPVPAMPNALTPCTFSLTCILFLCALILHSF